MTEKLSIQDLQDATTYGIVDADSFKQQVEMAKRADILKKHKYAITHMSDGRWSTYLPDDTTHLKTKAFNNLKTITTHIFEYARKKQWINWKVTELYGNLDIPRNALDRTKKPKKERVFTLNECKTLMDYLNQNRDLHNLCILLMCVSGLRVGEAVALKFSDFTGNKIMVQRSETFHSENGHIVYEIGNAKTDYSERTTTIPDAYTWIYDEVRALNPNGDYMFMKDGERMNSEMVRQRQYRLCDKLGIPRRSPHTCRRTYASILNTNHVDRQTIKDQLGHVDFKTTEDYYLYEVRDGQEIADTINNIAIFQCKDNALTATCIK